MFIVCFKFKCKWNGFFLWISLRQCKNIPDIDSLSFVLGRKHINIGKNFVAGKALRLQAIDRHRKQVFTPQLIIGDNVNLNDFVHIACCKKVVIGDNVLMAGKVFISDHTHGEYKINKTDISLIPIDRDLYCQDVVIGNNVWIGENVVILMGVTIGDNCIIGANSVVRQNAESGSVLAGVPAKLISRV